MEQTPSIWSRLLTKRQRSSPKTMPDSSKTFVFFEDKAKTNFFFTPTTVDSFEIAPHKKVKLESEASNVKVIDSPSTRIDENSPNMIACISPQIHFNEALLGSPASYDLEREVPEEIETELPTDNKNPNHSPDNESLKLVYQINKEILEIMEKKQGKVMVEKEIYHETYFFLVQCSFSHIWETNLENLRKNEWCDKCLEKYRKCLQFAEKKNWTLLNEIFLSDLTFRCALGHLITATAKNYEHKTACSVCKKNARQEHLEYLKAEEEKIFQERLKEQERLFEESRQHSSEEAKQQEEKQHFDNLSILSAYKQITIEIEPLARKYATDYIEKKDIEKDNFDRILEIYKILLIPDDIFKLYLNSLSEELLKKEYRLLARSIHPDKNSHPKAGAAFQKLNKIYEEALKKEEHTFSLPK